MPTRADSLDCPELDIVEPVTEWSIIAPKIVVQLRQRDRRCHPTQLDNSILGRVAIPVMPSIPMTPAHGLASVP